jgi:hypothetical protein
MGAPLLAAAAAAAARTRACRGAVSPASSSVTLLALLLWALQIRVYPHTAWNSHLCARSRSPLGSCHCVPIGSPRVVPTVIISPLACAFSRRLPARGVWSTFYTASQGCRQSAGAPAACLVSRSTASTTLLGVCDARSVESEHSTRSEGHRGKRGGGDGGGKAGSPACARGVQALRERGGGGGVQLWMV